MNAFTAAILSPRQFNDASVQCCAVVDDGWQASRQAMTPAPGKISMTLQNASSPSARDPVLVFGLAAMSLSASVPDKGPAAVST